MSFRHILMPASILAVTACAVDAKELPVLDPGNPFLSEIQPNIAAEEFIARAMRPFDQMSPDGGAISRQDLNDKRDIAAAQRRASNVNSVLRYDLNGDFKVTADEVRLVMQKEYARRTRSGPAGADAQSRVNANAESFFSSHDANKDGFIDVPEAAVEPARPFLRAEQPSKLEQLAETSLGADGQVTRAEVKTYAERTFAAIDKNRDGKISTEEYQTIAAIRDAGSRN